MESKTKRIKTIRTLALIMCLVISLTSVTYSWIKREWTPNVSGSNIKIASDGSLVFSLVNSDGEPLPGSVTDSLGLSNGAALKPVSSQNGAHGTFFNVNYSVDDGVFESINEGSKTGEALMKEHGFTELVFLIRAAEEETTKNVKKCIFLTPQCYITAQDPTQKENSVEAAQSMRVAIEVQHAGAQQSENIFLFKNQDVEYVGNDYALKFSEGLPVVTHTAVTAEKGANGFIADGKPYDEIDEQTGKNKYEETRTASLFSDFYGDIWEKMEPSDVNDKGAVLQVKYNGEMHDTITDNKDSQLYRGYYYNDGTSWYKRNIEKEPNEDYCIGVLGAGESHLQLKVRVWLEGCDEFCTKDIRDCFVNLLVMFDFMDIAV